MAHDFPPAYQCGDLRIIPSLGTVTDAAGASVRLGPVNMKVLEALLARPGEVVSRRELFDTVWKNQVISEDALTRCISDIRAELRIFSDREEWIETLPKRGYRWLAEVRELDVEAQSASPPGKHRPADSGTAPTAPRWSQRLARLALHATAYLAALAVMAIALVWTIDRFTGERATVVAILPTAAGPELAEQAAALDLALMAELMQNDRIRVLSPSAIGSRPANPFPFFSYEFGARWLIEAELRKVGGEPMLTLTVGDARTGIAEMQVTERWSMPSAAIGTSAPAPFEALSRFIEAELGE